MLALSHIKNNLSGDLSLVRLADCVGILPTSFSTLFNQETGMSLNEYITAARIDMAKALMDQSKAAASIDEIAERTGFSSAKYFRTIFKKQTGLTVAEYRKKIYTS